MRGDTVLSSRLRAGGAKAAHAMAGKIAIAALSCVLVLGQMPLAAWGSEPVQEVASAAADTAGEEASESAAHEAVGADGQAAVEGVASEGDAISSETPAEGALPEAVEGLEENADDAQGVEDSTAAIDASEAMDAREGLSGGIEASDAGASGGAELEVTPDEQLTMTVTVVGREADLTTETVWLYEEQVSAPAGSEATDYLTALFDDLGMEYSIKYGQDRANDMVTSLTSPDGTVQLGDPDDYYAYNSWYLFRDGKTTSSWTSEVGAAPQANEQWVLVYRMLPGSLPDLKPASLNTYVSVIGPDSGGFDTYWDDRRYVEVDFEAPARDASDRALAASGLVYTTDAAGDVVGIVSPYTGMSLAANAQTGKAWRLFVNGERVDGSIDSISIDATTRLVWYYAAADAELPSDGDLARANVRFSIADASGDLAQYWVDSDFATVEEGTTLLGLVKERLDRLASAYSISTLDGNPGFFFITSITSEAGVTKASAGWNVDEPSWHVFVNGVQYDQTVDATRVIKGGDSVELRFCVEDELLESNVVLFSVAGLNDEGVPALWASDVPLRFSANASGAKVVETLAKSCGLTIDLSSTDNGRSFVRSVASPNGKSVLVSEGPDADGVFSGRNWHIYVNGEDRGCWLDRVGSLDAPLHEGDTITLFFTEGSQTLPAIDGEIMPTDPDAARPDWGVDPSGFTTDRVVEAGEQDGKLGLSWSFEYGQKNTSEPLIVNGNVYLATGSVLNRIDAATGEVLCGVDLVATLDYTSRPVYAEGLVIVPLAAGRLAAYTADDLDLVWYSDAISLGEDGVQQSSSSLVYANGCVIAATMGGIGPLGESRSGAVYCVDVQTGETVWRQDNVAAGYYWAGAAIVQDGAYAVLAGDDGYVRSYDVKTGAVVDEYPLGESVRSGFVSDGEGAVYAMTATGSLAKLAIDERGAIQPRIEWQIFSSSTASAVISADRIYVAGTAFPLGGGNGALAVLDRATGTVEYEVTTDESGGPLPGPIQGTPLVVERPGGTYVYFTCNAPAGAVYEYRVGDDCARTLFTPDEDMQNYTIASVHMDDAGRLYYTNDAGVLFCLGFVGEQGGGSDQEGGDGLPVDDGPASGLDADGAGLAIAGGSSAGTKDPAGSLDARHEGVASESDGRTFAPAMFSSASDELASSNASTVDALDGQAFQNDLAPLAIAGIGVGVLGLAIGLVLFARSRKEA